MQLSGTEGIASDDMVRVGPSAGLPLTSSSRRQRLALYSHDTMGIGHLRRNLLIAKTLMQSGQVADCLLIAGARQVAAFSMPPGIDCVTLPSLFKHTSGRYCSQSLRMSLRRLVELRSEIIQATLKAYQPDLFLVDKNPRGIGGELDGTLEMLKDQGRTRCVLGLRDILDTPERVRQEWCQGVTTDAIEAFYEAVWVYGDPHLYDPVQEYQFPADVASKVRFTGYFDQRSRLSENSSDQAEFLASLQLPQGPLAVCMVGGGQDGEALAEAFLRSPLPPNFNGILVTGPCMHPEIRTRLRAAASESPRLRIVDFTPDPVRLLQCAERVVVMGGYNTVNEALSLEKNVLVVPRVVPRLEQWIRADRLREFGLVDVLHPSEVTPAAIGQWLSRKIDSPVSVHERFDFRGLDRIPELLVELRAMRSAAAGAMKGSTSNDRHARPIVSLSAYAK